VSSRARCLLSFVSDHDPPNVVGQPPFQATHRLVVGFAGRDLGVVVGASGAARHPHLAERDDMQGEVELAITAAGQAITDSVGAGNLHRGDAGVVGEGRRGTESAGASGVS
jgi:hypothetical protein